MPEHAAAPPPRPRSRLKPILIGVGLVTVLAIALVVTVMVGRSMPGPTTASPVDTAPRPTAAPRPQPTKPAVSSAATATTAVTDANDPVQLASRARAALDAGNFHEATEILSQPSLVGSRDPSVLDSARRVILALMDQAERAKASGHRDTATERLERARNLALRFSFSTTEIDVKFEELQGRRQALQISPNDSVALGRLRGKDIVVSLKDRTTREGLLRTINPDSITLEARRTVGAGYVTYTTTIPLNTIEVIEPQD